MSSFLVIEVTAAGLSSRRVAISARLSGPCRASSASTAVRVMSPETDPAPHRILLVPLALEPRRRPPLTEHSLECNVHGR